MEPTKKFLTKTGFCHVLKDKIIFTPSGFMGHIGDMTVEGRMSRILLFFSSLALLILYFAYANYLENQFLWTGIFGVIGSYLIYGIIKGLNTSMHPIINRSAIKEVRFVKGVQDLTPPSFEVKFANSMGKMKKRIISLPNPTAKNRSKIQEAINIMREEGLIE
ncbi:MAG: phosphoribosylaminoimidazolesuccinocarboxamide synthase [Cytophagales bacterium]|nr:phosphoribosylaminoimidazolesuccinocarboxamide synthase [Cytophagales bacterium]